MSHNEAPASWNVRYRTPEGFDAMLTLRGESGDQVLPKAAKALAWLQEHGCEPTNGHHKGNPQNENGGHQEDPSWCPIHNVQMTKRSKNGDTWYSHKAPDGTWCRGKAE